MNVVLEQEIPEACVTEVLGGWHVWQAGLWEIVGFKQ